MNNLPNNQDRNSTSENARNRQRPPIQYPYDRRNEGVMPQPNQQNSAQLGPNLMNTLSKEEVQLLKKCSGEAFWYRSLPLCVISSFAVSAAFKYNILTHKNFRFLTYGAMISMSYVTGKLMYLPRCVKRLQTYQRDHPPAITDPADPRYQAYNSGYFPGDQDPSSGMPSLQQNQDNTNNSRDGNNRPMGTTYEDRRRKHRHDIWQQSLQQMQPQRTAPPPDIPVRNVAEDPVVKPHEVQEEKRSGRYDGRYRDIQTENLTPLHEKGESKAKTRRNKYGDVDVY